MQPVDSHLWASCSEHAPIRIKIAKSFSWQFYGRRWANALIGVAPCFINDSYKMHPQMCEGYRVSLLLDSIDDMQVSVYTKCPDADTAMKVWTYIMKFFSVQPKGGLTHQFLMEYFKGYTVELW